MRGLRLWARGATAAALLLARPGPGTAVASVGRELEPPAEAPRAAVASCDGGASLEIVLSALRTAP